MKKTLDLQLLVEYIKLNWFKIGIAIFVLIMFLQKDMTFQLNLNTPETIETPTKAMPTPPTPPKKEKKSPSAITEVVAAKQKVVVEKFSVGETLTNTFKSFKAKNELHKVDEPTKHAYLKRFAKVVVSESDKYGIPASIILANAMFHSFAGTRDMAKKEGNNHFAIPCTDDWTDSRGTYGGACYRHYENAWMSFRNHSMYVTSGRFASLKGLSSTDYKAWAKELESKGYSEYDDLADNLIKIIQEYGLHELDR